MKEFLKNIATSTMAKSLIPLGYGYGLPLVSTLNGKTIIRIPFFKETFRPNDKTLIYPVQYLISALWENGRVVEGRDLSFTPVFQKIEMNRPIGLFRHAAVAHMNKQQYLAEKDALYTCYDKFLASVTEGAAFSNEDEKCFVEKMNTILEPSLKPFYFAIDKTFSDRFIQK